MAKCQQSATMTGKSRVRFVSAIVIYHEISAFGITFNVIFFLPNPIFFLHLIYHLCVEFGAIWYARSWGQWDDFMLLLIMNVIIVVWCSFVVVPNLFTMGNLGKPQRLEINAFRNVFEWSGHKAACKAKNKFQKTVDFSLYSLHTFTFFHF